ncbi:hypothetical protein GH714_039112 [Hevea brasiliensis]|uniref:Plastid lipid-associated protein/fibrillin conserved domain-containing protein n=1 Tax=Hevea brasiliensis TaxID=3981 RepID=A0A6A6MTX7_HEVBR|nr:hypothetical protein GH714_039112 [Hevea brasiliensis]
MATCFLLPIHLKPKNSPKPTSFHSPKVTCSSATTQSQSAKEHLLSLISDQDRGLKTQNDPEKRASIIQAIDAMAEKGKGTVTTGNSLSATWRLLWTTEKEQLFIIEKAPLFGTKAGDVLQVIDVEKGLSTTFTSAVLRGKSWEIPLPPFGQGWFKSVYLDDDLRIANDVRGDYLIVARAPYNWSE